MASPGSQPAPDPLVQYVVLRRDLWREQGWPLGAVAAQACHASSAAIWSARDDADTIAYLAEENIDHMHKVVLEAKGAPQLQTLSEKLSEGGVKHKLWVEQPENVPTAVATAPRRKSEIAPLMKRFQLARSAIGNSS